MGTSLRRRSIKEGTKEEKPICPIIRLDDLGVKKGSHHGVAKKEVGTPVSEEDNREKKNLGKNKVILVRKVGTLPQEE